MTDRYEPDFAPDFTEEELVRACDAVPVLRADLRDQILAEATAAQSRRRGARCSAILTGFVVFSMGLVLGLSPPASSEDKPAAPPAVAEHPEWEPALSRSTAIALLTDRFEMTATAGDGEWDQVEAFVLLRQAGRVVISGMP